VAEIELRVFGANPPVPDASRLWPWPGRWPPSTRRTVLRVDAMSEEAQDYQFSMTPGIAIGKDVVFEGF